jgi:hypothetical protein
MILMSALPPKAEVARRRLHFRFVPTPEVSVSLRQIGFTESLPSADSNTRSNGFDLKNGIRLG